MKFYNMVVDTVETIDVVVYGRRLYFIYHDARMCRHSRPPWSKCL